MEGQADPNNEQVSDSLTGSGLLIPLIFLYLMFQLGVPIWAIVVISIWYFSLVYCENKGILDRLDATRVLGAILMLRTRKGKGILELVSRRRMFWRIYGEFSIWLCFFVMLGVIVLLLMSAILAALDPPNDPIPASDLLLIPGVTSFVPFQWPVIALIVAIIIHEYSHGIQARAHGMRLRSFGLLLLGPLPIGAFAEPEESEMERAPRRDRLRLFAAGPSINLIATFVVLIILSNVANGMVAEDKGVHARDIVKDQGADQAGILPYETITHINGSRITDTDEFSDQMEELKPGDIVPFTILTNPLSEDTRVERIVNVTLGDHHQYLMERCNASETCEEEELSEMLIEFCEDGDGDGEADVPTLCVSPGDSFLGVSQLVSSTYSMDVYSNIVNGEYSTSGTVLATIARPMLMIYTPIELEGQTIRQEERAMLVAGDGLIASMLGTELMLDIFDFLFWLVWINFLLGFANLIPMIPFDGGHLVRDATHSILKKIGSKTHPMRIEMLSNRISNLSSIFFLLILLIPVILPRII